MSRLAGEVAVTASEQAPMLSAPLSMSRLSLLVDLASLLAREVDLDTLLSHACDRMAEALRADRASIWLVDDPFRYRILEVESLIDPDICFAYPRRAYPENAVVPQEKIAEIFARYTLKMSIEIG